MGPVVIVGCGMTTPVGLTAPETAASARARTARLTEIEWRDSRYKGFVVGIVPDDCLPQLHPDLESQPLSFRESRMLCLADSALQEALASLPKSVRSISLLLGMPELHTTVPIEPKQFLSRLAKQSKATLDLSRSRALPQGRAAGLLAVKDAAESLARGRELFVLAGGVDSYVDLYVLGTLDMQKRVRTDVNPDGFTPGEGAGFVLMTTESVARQHKLETLARIVACSASREEGHIYSDKPYRGDGLAGAFESLFASAGGSKPAACVYASFNGEHYWARELGVAVVRHKQHFTDDYQTEHPSECFGDLGAAHGPVMLGLTCLGMKDGYRPSPTIVYSSSDFGDRAAVLVARTEPESASPQRR